MTNPHGQEEAHGEAEQMRHRAAAELTGAHRSSPESGEGVVGEGVARGGLGLGDDRAGEASEGRPAGPSRFGQAHPG
jgi:hypothetical protein